jgi:cellulose synthase/poly-beta-1,6-N-acetylglucosamine synthase-like glycosyltransferase
MSAAGSRERRLQATPFLSIVIPAYNEENRTGRTLAQTPEYLDARNYEAINPK